MADEAWPIALLVLRIAVVVVLYLFLLAAVRALRAELRAPALQLAPAPLPADEDWEEVDFVEGAEGIPPAPPIPSGPEASHRRERTPGTTRRRVPLALAIPAGAAAVVLVLGGAAAFALRSPDARAPGGVAAAPADEPFGPPVVQPATGHVTVGLAAQEDTLVRVTVDGVVQFDGMLKARQRQAWDGAQRVQVWTDKGKTLLIAINGKDLGPYSPAMGHADWNRIDFGFLPG